MKNYDLEKLPGITVQPSFLRVLLEQGKEKRGKKGNRGGRKRPRVKAE